jgi:hypothetical protein
MPRTAPQVFLFMTLPPCVQRFPRTFIWNFDPCEYTTLAQFSPSRDGLRAISDETIRRKWASYILLKGK